MAAGNLACHELFADGRLRPHIGAVYPLARVADALDDVLHRRATGKLVIDPTAG
jgi:NADPH2:quinone reductase